MYSKYCIDDLHYGYMIMIIIYKIFIFTVE